MNRPYRLVLLPAVLLALAGVTSCAGLVPILEGTPERRAPRKEPVLITDGPASAELSELVDLVNRYRRSKGLGTLAWDERVARVAKAHSNDMVRRGFFSHKSPDGRTPFDRLHAVGIQYHAAAENIAEGQETAEEVFRSWMNSPGHRKNLENASYTHQGIGLHRHHWTHILIRPR